MFFQSIFDVNLKLRSTKETGNMYSAVYFDQQLGAAPSNAGWNQWKIMVYAGITFKFN